MHDGMPYGRNQGQGHSREVDRQSPTGLIFVCWVVRCPVLSLGFAVRARAGGTCGVVIRRQGDSRSDEQVDQGRFCAW